MGKNPNKQPQRSRRRSGLGHGSRLRKSVNYCHLLRLNRVRSELAKEDEEKEEAEEKGEKEEGEEQEHKEQKQEHDPEVKTKDQLHVVWISFDVMQQLFFVLSSDLLKEM